MSARRSRWVRSRPHFLPQREITMLRLFAACLLSSVAFAQSYFSAALEGAQEVPPVATAGRGWGIVRLDPATNNVTVFLFHEALPGAPTAAHLHLGAVGVNG